MKIDKSWTKITRRTQSDEFWKGLKAFIEMAKPFANDRGMISCPCNKCVNRLNQLLDTVEAHIYRWGFMENYDVWIHHGENENVRANVTAQTEEVIGQDEMIDVLNDIVGDDSTTTVVSDVYYDQLFEALHLDLYPGVSSFSSLNFLVKLMHLKVINKWTNKSVDELLKLLKLAFPKINLVSSHYEAKKLMTKLGLGYQSIHVCKNDCALFWNEYADRHTCPICDESRWVQKAGKVSGKNVPQKVLRYFPLAPRLKRLFSTEHTAKLMRWHSTGQSKDEDIMRHPVDGKAWREFDKRHPQFAYDIRNVRLGLAADGFNPFGNLSQSYSMWPVVLTTYNLPPWLCMKSEYLMLTLLIPGPQSPGKDIDVFLRPLVDELKALWTTGVDTRDACCNNTIFRLHAALLWTVNDFPARSSLSGWSGQGYKACPTCNEETPSMRVAGKIAYVGHRRFLPSKHHFRSNLDFNGKTERRPPPHRLTSVDLLQQLSRVTNGIPGKHPSYGGVKRKRGDGELNWRKKSIFYELPYWSTIELKHNLDVMHVEKNVCDSLLGTILDDPQKSKDTVNARRDLMKLGIKKELHLYQEGNKWMKPVAEYTLTNSNRHRFCNFIRSVKFPDGFASNLRKNVAFNDNRITGLKSHDCHIIMQRLLPIGCRAYLNKTISSTIIELCTFFKQLCARSLKVSDMVSAQDKLILILCKLERIFPPAFFDIMIHLVMHLPEETILGGLVYMRWMYPFERYLKKLKDYVRNAAKPEGSIAEGYVVDEALTFCSRYFDDVETRFNRSDRNQDVSVPKRQLSVFESQCHLIGKSTSKMLPVDLRHQAEFYILNNCPEIEEYVIEHKHELSQCYNSNINELHRKEFPAWFHSKVYTMHQKNAPQVTQELLSLASRSNMQVYSYTACVVNGVRFLTYDRDVRRKTQNSGVSVPGTENETYYGQLQEILELSYLNGFSVVLFRCKWFRCNGKRKITENGITSIDIGAESYKDDQFVLASQAKQVFYIEDSSRGPSWRVVQEVHHRSIWDVPGNDLNEIDLLHDNNSSSFPLFVDIGNLEQMSLQWDNGKAVQVDGSAYNASSCNETGVALFINDEEEFDDTLEDYMDDVTNDNISGDDDNDVGISKYLDSDSE